jgi:hypothetical protein
MRATRLAMLNHARKYFCKKWEELCGNTLIFFEKSKPV